MSKSMKMFCGTPSYMAPEIVARKVFCGFKADIWAIGIILFAMVSGHMPFKGPGDRELYRKIQLGFFTIPEFVSE